MTTHANNLRDVYQRIDLKRCSFDELQKMFEIYLRSGMEDIADEIADFLYFNTDASGTLITSIPDHPPTQADEVPGWLKIFPFKYFWKQRPR
jgi:hypothetical protein